jgi:uncharacterized protein YndB with AHSA1/START domain
MDPSKSNLRTPMPPVTTIATSHFRFTTSASPDQVWAALTRREHTVHYLFGMALESEWQVGAVIVARPPAPSGIEGSLGGEVLAVDDARRLTYTLSAGPGDPVTFVTWEIEPADDGSVVKLSVDETQLASHRDKDSEAAWLQVVSTLRTTLAHLLL